MLTKEVLEGKFNWEDLTKEEQGFYERVLRFRPKDEHELTAHDFLVLALFYMGIDYIRDNYPGYRVNEQNHHEVVFELLKSSRPYHIAYTYDVAIFGGDSNFKKNTYRVFNNQPMMA